MIALLLILLIIIDCYYEVVTSKRDLFSRRSLAVDILFTSLMKLDNAFMS